MKLSNLLSLGASGGTPPNARSPHDGSVGSDFGSMLTGMVKDATAGAPSKVVPEAPANAETRAASVSVADVHVTEDEGEGETGSRQAMSTLAKGEPQVPEVAVAAAAQVAGFDSNARGSGLASLLTLAARAAEPAQSGIVKPATASALLSVAATASKGKDQGPSTDDPSSDSTAAQESDGHVRRPSKIYEGSDDQAGIVPMAMAMVPTVVVGSVAAASPNDADALKPTSRLPVFPAPAFGAKDQGLHAIKPSLNSTIDGAAQESGRDDGDDNQADAASATTMAPMPVAPVATEVTTAQAALTSKQASVANSSPTASTGPLRSAAVAPATVDAAILPGTVRVESHLGFDRGVLIGRAEAPGGSVSGHSVGEAVVANQSEGRQTAGVPPVALVSETASDDVGAAASLVSDPASKSSTPSSDDIVLPTAMLDVEGVGALSADTVRSSPAKAKNTAMIDAERLAVPPFAPEADRASFDAAGSAPSRLLSTRDTSKPALGSPSIKVATDEPDPAVVATTAPLPATAVAGIAVLNPQATTPSVVQQVADGVVGLASPVLPDEDAALGTQVAPARTMTLQLSPSGLGTLNVRLHVTGRALDVHLEASDDRTAALIARDRDTLSGALSGKDYQLQSLNVTTQDTAVSGGTHAERGTDPGSPDGGSPGSFRDGPAEDRSGNQRSREAPARDARPSRRTTGDVALERGGSSLFV